MLCSYNYSRDDEEIYKEFLDIANELIPHIMRVVSSGVQAHSILKVYCGQWCRVLVHRALDVQGILWPMIRGAGALDTQGILWPAVQGAGALDTQGIL